MVIEGTRGTLVCTPRSVELWRGDELECETSSFAWFPDAFRGPYLQLVEALARGTQPSNAGAIHLRVAALVEAAYRSAATTRVVHLEELDG